MASQKHRLTYSHLLYWQIDTDMIILLCNVYMYIVYCILYNGFLVTSDNASLQYLSSTGWMFQKLRITKISRFVYKSKEFTIYLSIFRC